MTAEVIRMHDDSAPVPIGTTKKWLSTKVAWPGSSNY